MGKLANLYSEISRFEYPLAVVADKRKVGCLKLEGYCACFSRLKLDLFKATKTTTIMKWDVVSRSRNMHSMEDTVAKITDMEAEINADIDRLMDLKKEIGETIRRVEDPRQRTVLEYCYLCYMRFTKIAEVLNYGESTIRVWHQKGLERLESFLNPDENLAENSGK